MPRIRNINPLGEVHVPLLGRVLGAGEVVDVTDEQASRLLEQAGNYEQAEDAPEPEGDN